MAGSVTVFSDRVYGEVREVVYACIGDASDGSIPDTDLCALTGHIYGSIQGWGFWLAETLFGTTAPTDGSAIYLKTEHGSDLLQGGGATAIKAAANTAIWPLIPVVPIGAKLTLDVNGQSVNSALYKIKLHLVG